MSPLNEFIVEDAALAWFGDHARLVDFGDVRANDLEIPGKCVMDVRRITLTLLD